MPCFCLPACCNCPVALSEFTALILMIQLCLNLTTSKNAIAAGITRCKYNLLRKCGLLAHTSAAFLKNCCTEKLLFCLQLVTRLPYSWKTNYVRFGRIASLSACVLFAGGCVVRITFQSFLDFRFLEFFLFAKWRTAFAHFS